MCFFSFLRAVLLVPLALLSCWTLAFTWYFIVFVPLVLPSSQINDNDELEGAAALALGRRFAFTHPVVSLFCVKWRHVCDVKSKIRLRQSIHSRNNPAMFHPNLMWSDGAVGFFEELVPTPNGTNKKNKMSSDMRSVRRGVAMHQVLSGPDIGAPRQNFWVRQISPYKNKFSSVVVPAPLPSPSLSSLLLEVGPVCLGEHCELSNGV